MGEPAEPGPLETLLKSIGLLSVDVDPVGIGPWFPAPPQTEFALIDDMSSRGWTRVLETALGKPMSCVLETTEDLMRLPGLIQAALTSGDPIQFTSARREIVFLDLRLFAGAKDSEDEFFGKLL